MATTNRTPAETEAVPFDAHGIDPIPPASRDSTPVEQFWIWFGANLAPINWVLGALGIVLGLSLLETIVVVALGNAAGCAIFGAFNVIGHRTAVNQMVLGRSPFGLRGNIVPGVIQGLLTMAWVGVNTWVVLDLNDSTSVEACATLAVDWVVHLAAVSSVSLSMSQPVDTWRVNLMGTVALFEALAAHRGRRDLRVLLASTAEVYGPGIREPRLETDRLNPIRGLPPSLINVPPGCAFHPRCPYRFEPCDKEVPELVPVDGHHASACHLPLAEKERIVREEVLAAR